MPRRGVDRCGDGMPLLSVADQSATTNGLWIIGMAAEAEEFEIPPVGV